MKVLIINENNILKKLDLTSQRSKNRNRETLFVKHWLAWFRSKKSATATLRWKWDPADLCWWTTDIDGVVKHLEHLTYASWAAIERPICRLRFWTTSRSVAAGWRYPSVSAHHTSSKTSIHIFYHCWNIIKCKKRNNDSICIILLSTW